MCLLRVQDSLLPRSGLHCGLFTKVSTHPWLSSLYPSCPFSHETPAHLNSCWYLLFRGSEPSHAWWVLLCVWFLLRHSSVRATQDLDREGTASGTAGVPFHMVRNLMMLGLQGSSGVTSLWTLLECLQGDVTVSPLDSNANC